MSVMCKEANFGRSRHGVGSIRYDVVYNISKEGKRHGKAILDEKLIRMARELCPFTNQHVCEGEWEWTVDHEGEEGKMELIQC